MKITKLMLPLLLLAVLPVLLLATQTANLSVLFTLDTDIPYRQAVMDTDSTLCLYNYANYSSPQQILTRQRIHADGFIEPQQTLFSFPGDTVNYETFYRAAYFPIEGNSVRFVFVNMVDIILIFVSGTDVTSYSTPNVTGAGQYSRYLLFNDRLFFIGQDSEPHQQLWAWNYLDDDISPVFDFHPEATDPRVAKLGTDRLVISQFNHETTTPEQYPVMLMDSQFNLSPTNVCNRIISPVYSFDETHFFADWMSATVYDWPADCSGVISVDSGNFTFATWSTSGDPYDEYSTRHNFRFALPGNLHTCIYYYGGMSGEYYYYNIYSYDGQGHVTLHSGFPQTDIYPYPPRHLSLYQDKLLLIYLVDGQHDFRLADLNDQEWIPVNGSPMEWPDLSSQYFNLMHSNNYIYGIQNGSYNHATTLTCMKLDIAVSTDDPVAALPALKAYPNPFQSTVKLEFDSIDTHPDVEIYNLRGQKVRTLPSQPDGVLWDGKDTSGNRLSSGIYFARPQAGSQKSLKLLKLGD